MAFASSQLANGQLANSIGDIYTSSSATTIVKSITLVNTNTTHEHVNLYVLKASGTARRIIPKDMTLMPNYSLVFDSVITLGSGDKLQGDTTTASKVDYVISGATQAV
jgi:hypothetical protein